MRLNAAWLKLDCSRSDSATQHPDTPCHTDTIGNHCSHELHDYAGALRAGATLLNLISHRLQPHGVTGLALGTE